MASRESRPDAITDATTERQIQDAAHMLLDLCMAATPPAGTSVPDAPGYHVSCSLSLAVQALFMVDDLQIGKTIEERRKGGAITAERLMTRCFGLGVGVGQCLGAISDIGGQLVAFTSFSKGLAAGQEGRIDMGKRPGR